MPQNAKMMCPIFIIGDLQKLFGGILFCRSTFSQIPLTTILQILVTAFLKSKGYTSRHF